MIAAATAMTKQDFDAIVGLAYDAAGLVFAPGKQTMVASRLAPLMRAGGCQSMAEYLARVQRDAAERDRLIGALTTNHTAFFRECHHFRHVQSTLRPELVRRLEAGGRARFWSAGCSTGAEVYSLAMVMLGTDRERGHRLASSDMRFLATDIAEHALAVGTAGQWPVAEADAVPEQFARLWFETDQGQATINPLIRNLVSFRQLNLMLQWPMTGLFDAIFCRNVMIYFDASTKNRLLERLAGLLQPGGFLYIGHSERVTGPAEQMVVQVGNTIYSRVQP